MSSFLYPDSFTRKMFNDKSAPQKHSSAWYKKRDRQKRESMMARAQRLTEEKGLLQAQSTAPQVKSAFSKLISKIKNFLSSFLKW